MLILIAICTVFISFLIVINIINKVAKKKKVAKQSMLVFSLLSLIFMSLSLFGYIKKNNIEIDLSFLEKKTIIDKSSDLVHLEKDKPFLVVNDDKVLGQYPTYQSAVSQSGDNLKISYLEPTNIIWKNENVRISQILLDVPHIQQFPELPRGCEVTSLAMLLQYNNISASKLELAEKIKKNLTPYERRGDTVYFGNPNNGFVGDMYSFNNPGLGVYHKPIKRLAENYLPNNIVDFTGADFEHVIYHVSKGRPVWMITNVQFKKLDDHYFETWITEDGPMNITYQEHSVIVTGFDDQHIYFNDPLAEEKNARAEKRHFIEAWEQMGKQAIIIID